METEKKRLFSVKLLKAAFKLAIAGGIVAILVSRDTAELEKCLETFDYRWLVPAVLCYILHMVVCALRWHSLTKVLNIGLNKFEAISLTMQAYFFSLVMPGGAIGGDLVKIGVLSSRTKSGNKLEGAFTILMDRIAGMIALFMLTIVITIPAIPMLMKISIPDIPLSNNMKIVCIAGLFVLCIAGLGSSFAIFLHRFFEKMPITGTLMRMADRWTHGMISRMTAAVDIYRTHAMIVFNSVLISIPFVHLMTVVVFFFAAKGLQADNATLFTMLVAVTIGNIAGLIPLAPGGIGIRDVTVISILAAGGMAPGEAKTVQLLCTAIMIVCNLLAGIFFIVSPKGENQK